MILRFFSGSVTPASLVEEAVGGVDRDEVQAQLVAQVLLHFLEFVLAQHAVVHEDAGETRLAVESRMARSTSVAATDESTPPERAQIARPSADLLL